MYDEIKSYKTLILYILKDIEIVDLKKELDGKKIFDHDIEDILNQEWYEIDSQKLDIERIDNIRFRNRFRLK